MFPSDQETETFWDHWRVKCIEVLSKVWSLVSFIMCDAFVGKCGHYPWLFVSALMHQIHQTSKWDNHKRDHRFYLRKLSKGFNITEGMDNGNEMKRNSICEANHSIENNDTKLIYIMKMLFVETKFISHRSNFGAI